MPKRAIVIFPQLENAASIEAMRRRFDPLAAHVPAHITLVFPFEDSTSAEELKAHVEQAVKGVKPFPLRLQGVTGHEGEWLFLNVKRGNDAIIELHDRLYAGPLARHLSLTQTYMPHLTVGRVYQSGILRDAILDAQARNDVYETTVKEIAVYTIRADGTRDVEFTVPLG